MHFNLCNPHVPALEYFAGLEVIPSCWIVSLRFLLIWNVGLNFLKFIKGGKLYFSTFSIFFAQFAHLINKFLTHWLLLSPQILSTNFGFSASFFLVCSTEITTFSVDVLCFSLHSSFFLFTYYLLPLISLLIVIFSSSFLTALRWRGMWLSLIPRVLVRVRVMRKLMKRWVMGIMFRARNQTQIPKEKWEWVFHSGRLNWNQTQITSECSYFVVYELMIFCWLA